MWAVREKPGSASTMVLVWTRSSAPGAARWKAGQISEKYQELRVAPNRQSSGMRRSRHPRKLATSPRLARGPSRSWNQASSNETRPGHSRFTRATLSDVARLPIVALHREEALPCLRVEELAQIRAQEVIGRRASDRRRCLLFLGPVLGGEEERELGGDDPRDAWVEGADPDRRGGASAKPHQEDGADAQLALEQRDGRPRVVHEDPALDGVVELGDLGELVRPSAVSDPVGIGSKRDPAAPGELARQLHVETIPGSAAVESRRDHQDCRPRRVDDGGKVEDRAQRPAGSTGSRRPARPRHPAGGISQSVAFAGEGVGRVRPGLGSSAATHRRVGAKSASGFTAYSSFCCHGGGAWASSSFAPSASLS